MATAAGAALGAAGVTAGASLFSSGKTNSANKAIAQMNNAFNERMLEKQMAYNTEMYDKQLGDQWSFYNDAKENQWDMFNATNRYNSAANQRKRFEAAGLNPYMMMGGSNAGTAQGVAGSSASSPSAQGINPPTATPYSANFDGYAEAVGRAMDVGLKMQEQKKVRAEAEQVQIENKYRAQKLLSEIHQSLSNTKNDREKVQIQKFLAQTQKDLASAQISNYEQNTAESKVRMSFQAQEILFREKELQFLPTAQKLQVSSQLADIALKQKQGLLTANQAKTEVWNMVRSQYLSKQAKQEADYFDASKDYKLQSEANEAWRLYKGPTGDIFNSLWHIVESLR